MKILRDGSSSSSCAGCCSCLFFFFFFFFFLASISSIITGTTRPAAAAAAAFVNTSGRIGKLSRRRYNHHYHLQDTTKLWWCSSSSSTTCCSFGTKTYKLQLFSSSSRSISISSSRKSIPFTITSMSMTKEQQQQQQQQQQPYPLIDVDCNLLHPDLMNRNLLVPADGSDNHEQEVAVQEQQQEDKNKGSNHDDVFWILNHPSTLLSNIQGIFSPSSTLDEAEHMYDLLYQRQQQQQQQQQLLTNAKCMDDDKDQEEKYHDMITSTTSTTTTNIDIRMSVGVHPYHAVGSPYHGGSGKNGRSHPQERIRQLIQMDQQEHGTNFITCIGETGLDYSEGFPSRHEQMEWFQYQLELAREYNLRLFLHERLAFEDTIRLIDEVFGVEESVDCSAAAAAAAAAPPPPPPPPTKMIVHCFTGTKQECMEYVKRGYYLSVSGYILKSGEGPRQVQECLMDGIIPLDKLMIETDAPYMGFASCRDLFYQVESKRNESSFQQLNNKTKKRYLKGIYPNVPSSLPMVLESVVYWINEGRRARGEDEIAVQDGAKIFHENAVEFFGFFKKSK